MIDYSTTLPHRGVVAIRGTDRHKFLQGLVTQDVMLAQQDVGVYAALLTPQGKFLHDMFIVAADDALWLDCETARIDDLIRRLERYKLRSDVVLTNLSADYGVAVQIERHPCVGRDPISLTPMPIQKNGIPACAGITDEWWFPDPRLPALGQRMIGARTRLPAHNPMAESAYNHLRLCLGVPDGSRDMIVGESILLEYNLEQLNAISFTKGCYVGQELTARTYHRALIKKRAFPVRIEGQCPMLGTPVLADGQEVGVMRSGQGDVGLAVLKTNIVRNGAKLICGTATLTAQAQSWQKISDP